MNIPQFSEAIRNAYLNLRETVEAANTEFLNRVTAISAEFHGEDSPPEVPYDSHKLESYRKSRDI